MQKDEHAAMETGSTTVTRKRQNNEERRPGRDDDDDAPTETFVTTPQLATPEEMAKRRILRVVRPEATTTTTASTSTGSVSGGAPGGFFKFLAAQNTAAPTAVAPAFSMAQPFGANVTAGKPAPLTTITTASPFAFAPTHTTDPAKEKVGATTGDTTQPVPLFGAGAFSFGNAVSSFVEARKKMEAAHAQQHAASSDASSAEPRKMQGESGEEGDGDEADQSFGGKPVVAPAAGEVLAVAPCKLYAFDKVDSGAGKWVERGMGEVKLKKQVAATEDRVTTSTSEASDTIYRLLVRDGYSLNVTLGKGTLLLSKVEAKHIIFNAIGASGPTTYMLRFTGPEAEASTRLFAEQLRKYVADVAADKA